MVRLSDMFLEWNYYPRRRLIEEMLVGGKGSPEKLFLEFTRHNPVLCTAAVGEDGTIEVNGKVVGCGYVVKREVMSEVIKVFGEHLKTTDELYEEARGDKDKLREVYSEHSKRGAKLLLKYIYLPKGEAEGVVDFEKLATVELAKRIPWSSKHTWRIVQRSRRACLVFYQPPTISFEVRGEISIHLDDDYHRLVTLVHDAYHYTPPEHRSDRPVYILHVLEVYDNSASRSGFGRRLA